MENKKKHRATCRSAFTRCANELSLLLEDENVDFVDVQATWDMLQLKKTNLEMVDEDIYQDLLADGSVSEEDLVADMEAADGYRKRFATLRVK